jgi:hypothetical protein
MLVQVDESEEMGLGLFLELAVDNPTRSASLMVLPNFRHISTRTFASFKE